MLRAAHAVHSPPKALPNVPLILKSPLFPRIHTSTFENLGAACCCFRACTALGLNCANTPRDGLGDVLCGHLA